MKKLFYRTIILLFIPCFQACNMFESHPYATYVNGEKDLNNTNIKRVTEKLKGQKEIRFAFFSDTQRWYDETKDYVAYINKRNDVDFILHGGDLTDFGARNEFILQRDIMLGFNKPWFALLGNHDCLGTGEDVYEEIWGDPNFYFVAGNVLFICLNTNCMEYDYSEAIPDFLFLERLLNNLPEEVEKTVVVMHVPPFDLEFNNNVAHVFQLYLIQFPNLQFCLNGHGHDYSVKDIFEDGILYYMTPCVQKRQYLLFTINEEGYEHELVEF